LKAERSKNAKDVSPELIRPETMFEMEEIRGVEADEGEGEQTDGEENATDNKVEGKHSKKIIGGRKKIARRQHMRRRKMMKRLRQQWKNTGRIRRRKYRRRGIVT